MLIKELKKVIIVNFFMKVSSKLTEINAGKKKKFCSVFTRLSKHLHSQAEKKGEER